MKELVITIELVTALVQEQFPQYAYLPIKPVEKTGNDNRTFYLSDVMSIRLLSEEFYACQVPKEQKWLPVLRSFISCPIIPQPIELGVPTSEYPFFWSIYKWISGERLSDAKLDNESLDTIAKSLAQFLQKLHKIPSDNGPQPGKFHRGGDVRNCIPK